MECVRPRVFCQVYLQQAITAPEDEVDYGPQIKCGVVKERILSTDELAAANTALRAATSMSCDQDMLGGKHGSPTI